MKTFLADGEGYMFLINDDGVKIGICPLSDPQFGIKCNTIKEAKNAKLNNWFLESDNGGNYEFYDNIKNGFEMEFYADGLVITKIYYDTIEEW
jgi:hypothetical protein